MVMFPLITSVDLGYLYRPIWQWKPDSALSTEIKLERIYWNHITLQEILKGTLKAENK